MTLRVRERTPKGSGAVSVLAISGDGALAAVRTLSVAAAIPIGRPTKLRLRQGDDDLDEAIVCAFSEDEVELHLHGSPPLVRRVIGCLGADPGPAEEAVTLEGLARALLATAPCEAGARILLDQAEGSLSRALRSLVGMSAAERDAAIETLLERWRIARWALRPATVVLAGRANAGKSTLFNALLGERRAIVDAEPGTTRDLNRASARFGAWPVVLVDTAGDRDTQASVEAEGQKRARDARAAADLVLRLEPIGSTATPETEQRVVLLRTFADLADPCSRPSNAVSALREPAAARELVANAFRAKLDLPRDPWTPREAVPFAHDLAREIESLRGLTPEALATAIERLLRAPGCVEEIRRLTCLPGIA